VNPSAVGEIGSVHANSGATSGWDQCDAVDFAELPDRLVRVRDHKPVTGLPEVACVLRSEPDRAEGLRNQRLHLGLHRVQQVITGFRRTHDVDSQYGMGMRVVMT
jgi:hypothetical protein